MKVIHLLESKGKAGTLLDQVRIDKGRNGHPGRASVLEQVIKKHGNLHVLADYDSDPEGFGEALGIDPDDSITDQVKKLKGMKHETIESTGHADSDDFIDAEMWWNGEMGLLIIGDFGTWAVAK